MIVVKEFITGGEWNRHKLLEYISEEMDDHIMENISPKLTKWQH